jgi:hypothetical protein
VANTLADRIGAARARLDGGAALSKDDISVLLNLSIRTIERMVNAGKLPEPDLVLNTRRIRWANRTIRPFIDGKGAA